MHPEMQPMEQLLQALPQLVQQHLLSDREYSCM